MKINGIKALDYQCQGDSLTLVLTETTFDAVSNLTPRSSRSAPMTAIWLRRTAAMRCVPSPTTRTSRRILSLAPRPPTIRPRRQISQLVSKVEELETSNTALAAQVDYISMMTDTEVA